ncbi:MAG: metal-sensitive transcriptional regulator [Thermotogota bacterium]|nr:metal-sensitive transcriptional regulator [Thermotogota bacterium]
MGKDQNKPIIVRLKKIEGQVRGLQRMIETDKPCAEVLVQVSAVQSALRMVGKKIIENYASVCLADFQAIASHYDAGVSENGQEKSATSSDFKEKIEVLSELIGLLTGSEQPLKTRLSEGENE